MTRSLNRLLELLLLLWDLLFLPKILCQAKVLDEDSRSWGLRDYSMIDHQQQQQEYYSRQTWTRELDPADVSENNGNEGIVTNVSRGGYTGNNEEANEEEDEKVDQDDETNDDEGEESTLVSKQDDDDDTSRELMEEILSVSQSAFKSTFLFVKRVVGISARALGRSIQAGLDEQENEKNLPVLTRIGKGIHRMLLALLDASAVPTASTKSSKQRKTEKGGRQEANVVSYGDDEVEEEEGKGTNQFTRKAVDYGLYLEKAYKVQGTRTSLDDPCMIHTGSFEFALAAARSEARLLLILIPSKNPTVKTSAADEDALKSFLSQDVSDMANRRARKQGGGTHGSFYLWSALPGSPMAINAMKRLKISPTNSKGVKRPVLAAVYAGQAVDAYGRAKVVPKLLAQHHASPPPSADMLAAWMNALRKRHAPQYAKMQKELAELALWKERKDGYQSSMQTDSENRKREEKEARRAKARAEAEKKRQEQIVARRARLKEEIPEEPDKTAANVKTVSVRLASGKSAQRRFLPDTPVKTLFNWVDVTFEVERETLVFTTLNGRTTLQWNDETEDDEQSQTLTDIGLSKMTGFRVSTAEGKKGDHAEPPSKGDEMKKQTPDAQTQ